MPAKFKSGERVYVTAGLHILEARVDRLRYGRYIVSYRSVCCEAEGHICVSASRLYRDRADAAARIDQRRAHTEPPRPLPRADEPGDGWAMR